MDLDFKPYIRLAMYHTWLYDYFADRSLYDHEIIFIDKGMMKIEFDDETCIVKKDDAVFIRPNEHHKITWYETNCCQPHVHFDFNKDELSPIIPVSMKRKEHMREVELTYFREDYLKQHPRRAINVYLFQQLFQIYLLISNMPHQRNNIRCLTLFQQLYHKGFSPMQYRVKAYHQS